MMGRTNLVDNLIPLLTSDSDLDSLLHQTGRDDNTMHLMRHPTGGLGDL